MSIFCLKLAIFSKPLLNMTQCAITRPPGHSALYTHPLSHYLGSATLGEHNSLEIMFCVVLSSFESSDPLFHGILLLPRDLLPLDDPGLDEEEYARDVLEDDAYEAQSERPREVVVLPVGHEVAAVTFDSEDDEGDGAECARDDEVDAGPPEDGDAVVLVDAEEVHDDEDDGDEHADEAQREEELRCLEEGWLELVAKYVVLLEEDVLAPVELGLVLVPPVEVAIQANHP